MKHEYAKEFVAPAVEYLTAAKAENKSDGRYAKVLRAPVCEALIGFCQEDGEFAEAVAQTKDIDGCLKAVAKGIGIGSAISDLEVYARAACFYFPGAKIKMQMTIDLDGEGDAKEETQKPRRLELSIGDLL